VKSRWSDREAQQFIERFGAGYSDSQLGEDIALRVYTSQLIGSDPDLVLHGGGNTSVKSTFTDILGRRIPALYVKGSGWDLSDLEPPGLPGLDLEYLRKLRAVPRLSDEEMVNQLRTHMFDATGPNPSVEALLHANIDAKFVDHTHADAFIALTNNADADAMLAECFGDDISYVPYVMPGYILSIEAAKVFDAHPDAQGMLLLNHGLFTWGPDARTSYERHIELVDRAESYLRGRARRSTFSVSSLPAIDPAVAMPIIRGALAVRNGGRVAQRFVCTLDASEEARAFVDCPDLLAAANTGPLTPDHIIRTKELPMIVLPKSADESAIAGSVANALAEYTERYHDYVELCSKDRNVSITPLDPMPRVVLMPGLGMITVGNNAKAAHVAADIYRHTMAVKRLVSEISEYRALPQLDLFDVEYWSLEQAKLSGQRPKPLEGRVALITGGAGAIGRGIAKILRNNGAEIVLADIEKAEETADELKCFGIAMDVTSSESVAAAFRAVCERFGGVDIVVPNAGTALSKPIEDLSDAEARRVMDINFHGYLRTVQEGIRVLKHQDSGGHIVIISSKNVLAPGNEFSIYSASKAAGHQLGKVAAMELAPYGIKVNMVTPDAVFATEDDPAGEIRSGLWRTVGPDRAKAHKIASTELEAFYQDRNLLKAEVSAEDVGRAVLFFATDQTPTTGATLPVDGGIAQAFPR
jgi:rhamnulose-1-phosphate aldolase/alcohol dehydrogenase